MSETLHFVARARREKLEALRSLGVEPFAYRFDATHDIVAALQLLPVDAADGPPVAVAGRIVAWRPHGKTIFAHLADERSRIQVYFRRDELGEDTFAMLELLDIGDVIGVHGPLFRTRTGETTIRAAAVSLLAKSLRPLPYGKEEHVDGAVVRHSGFADPEQRYRQRYADLAVHAEVRRRFVARSRMITAIRRFLDDHDYLEVETPVLQPQYGGAAARPFLTEHRALEMPLYLRIADELYLKRLVVGGLDRVYEIGHDFRNEGIDRTHSPEFTMLEFYEAYADYEVMMKRVESLLTAAARAVHAELDASVISAEERLLLPDDALISVPTFEPPFPRLEWVTAIDAAAGVSVLSLDEPALRNLAQRAGVSSVESLSRPKVLDELFQELVEKRLSSTTFIVDFPKELSPLAKPKRGNPVLTERFELFARGTELANAFSELNDPDDQRQRLDAQSAQRAAGDAEAVGVDEDYLRAMEYGMPPMGGVGIGIDRLFMFLTNAQNIRDVILFSNDAAGMTNSLELRIAWRYLRSRRGSKLLSFISMIAIGGVIVGVSALIVVMGVMNGLQRDLREKILIGSPDIRVLTYGDDLVMTGWHSVLPRIRAARGVVAAAPFVLTQGLISAGHDFVTGTQIAGIEPQGRDTPEPTSIREHAIQGDFRFASSDGRQRGVVLGASLSRRLNVEPGDTVTIMTAAGLKPNAVTGTFVPRPVRFEVTGIVETGMYEYDDTYTYMSLATAQEIAGIGSAITGIDVRTQDRWRAREIGDALRDSLGYPYRAVDWQEQNSSLFQALNLEKLGMGIILLLIVLVAAFNIVSNLTMVVADKTREIGILKAMGMTARSVRRIFFSQGLVIGMAGTALGLVLGLVVAQTIGARKLIPLDPSVYYIDHLPVYTQLSDVLLTIAASITIAALATVYPARQAARLYPIEAIRHE